MRIALFCATILLPIAFSAAGFQRAMSAQITDDLTITFVDCTANIASLSRPRIVVGTLENGLGSGARTTYFKKVASERLYVFHQRLAPGAYDILVADGDCADEQTVQMLPLRDRHIVAIGSDKTTLDYPRASVAGILPASGFSASIVYDDRSNTAEGRCRGTAIPAVIEGDAYYAVGLPAGHACLRLSDQGRTAWYDFDLGSFPRHADVSGVAKIFNVSAQMLDECARRSDKRDTYVHGTGASQISVSVQPVCQISPQ